MSTTTFPPHPPKAGDPAWDIARLFPAQGHWGGEDYFLLNQLTNRYVEFTRGTIEVLEMPTKSHQEIVFFLCALLKSFCAKTGAGKALMAPYPVMVSDDVFREPDVVFMLTEHVDRLHEEFAEGADLVMEVLSQDRQRDLVRKRREYADGGIAEYWLVDRRDRMISVLRLDNGQYVTAGEYREGQIAASVLLSGFEVNVSEALAVGTTP
jgi:Uma2 family endonuclease